MMKSVICAVLSAPSRLPFSPTVKVGREREVTERNLTKCQDQHSLLLRERQSSRLLCFTRFLLPLCYLDFNAINTFAGKVKRTSLCSLLISSRATSQAKSSCCLCIISYSNNNLLNLNFSFTAATEMDLECNNVPTQIPAKCGWLHVFAFTWWNHKSSAAIQLWINHAECEFLPQEKPCVWERTRGRVSRILCNSRYSIPRQLVRRGLRTAVAVATRSEVPILCCLCSHWGVSGKTEIIWYRRTVYLPRRHRINKQTRQRQPIKNQQVYQMFLLLESAAVYRCINFPAPDRWLTGRSGLASESIPSRKRFLKRYRSAKPGRQPRSWVWRRQLKSFPL